MANFECKFYDKNNPLPKGASPVRNAEWINGRLVHPNTIEYDKLKNPEKYKQKK